MHFIVKQIFKYFLHFALPITHDFSCYLLQIMAHLCSRPASSYKFQFAIGL